MPASNRIPGELSVIAFKVAAVLETYQSQREWLAADCRNRPFYRAVGAQPDEISSLLGALPQLAVDLIEVVVCHGKLLHLLEAGDAPAVSRLCVRQTHAVSTLRRKSLKLICEPA